MNDSSFKSEHPVHCPSVAEEEGAEACRAGVPRNAVPTLCPCNRSSSVGGGECEQLVLSWRRGWDVTARLRAVSEQLFPASTLRVAADRKRTYRYVASS
jgi:hypothetical protein